MSLLKFRDGKRINKITKAIITIGIIGFIFYFAKIVLYPVNTTYDVSDIIYNQIKTAQPNEITIIKISKYKKGMLIHGIAKQNKHISLFMTAISKKDIGFPSLQSVTKSNQGNSFILMVKNK